MPRQPQPAPFDGALVIDKPAGKTSHDVVDAVRHLAGFRQIGHLGTLDPLATGVLVLLLGRATRLVQFYGGHTIDSGAMSFYDVTFNTSGDIAVTGTMTVSHNLTTTDTNSMTGGTIAVAGDIITTDTTVNGTMTTVILINGTGNQILGAGGGTGILPSVTINKSSGTLTLQNTLWIYQDWTHTAGTVIAGMRN